MSTTNSGENEGVQTPKKTASKTKIGNEPIYFEYIDGNNYKHKVANMNNPFICKRKGSVEIECIKKSNTNPPRFSISTVHDKELGLIFGVPLGIDSRTKEIRWARFVVEDFKRYDLSKKQDAVEWTIVSRAPWLAGSPFQRGKSHFRMYDREAIAKEVIETSTLRSKAEELARKSIPLEDLCDMYRNFGKNPEGFSYIMLQAEMIKIAQRSPKDFLNIWENTNRAVLTSFNRATQMGIVEYNAVKGGYLYKNLPLGLTDQAAIKYLLENKTLLAQIDLQSKELDTVAINIKKQTDNEKEFFGTQDATEDVELVELRMAAKVLGIKNVPGFTKAELQKEVDVLSENV